MSVPRWTPAETRALLRYAAAALRSQGERPPYAVNKAVPHGVFGRIAFTFWIDDAGEFVVGPPGRRGPISGALLN